MSGRCSGGKEQTVVAFIASNNGWHRGHNMPATCKFLAESKILVYHDLGLQKKSIALQRADFYVLFTAEADEGMEKFGMQTFCDDIWKRAQIYVHIMGPIICLHSF